MSCSDTQRFEAAMAAIDAANRQDPRGEEFLYSTRMTRWLERLYPEASEALRLAARAQHIRRWEIPRSSFPMDRIGYLSWRTKLYQFHAEQAAEILQQAGYGDELISRVRSLLKKEQIKTDPESQALEDVSCMVFFEFEFESFYALHSQDPAKIINILQRTWKKMSPRGHAEARSLFPAFPQAVRQIIHEALPQ